MSIQFCDNFQLYTEADMLNGLYAEVNQQTSSGIQIVADPDPTATGNVLYIAPQAGFSFNFVRKVIPTAGLTIGMAQRIYLSSLPSSTTCRPTVCQFRDTSSNALVSITVDPSGYLQARSGLASGALLGTSSSPAMVAGSWQHVECKVFMDAAAATIEVRVEGVTVLNLTGLALSATNIQNTVWGTYTALSAPADDSFMYVKDFVVWDASGSINNDFLGSCSVVTMTPNADSSFNWTASSGSTGYNLIDEAPPNDDTDYIEADATPPSASLFGMTDLPADVTSVKALMTLARARKTDGGDGNLQVGLKSSSSTATGSDRPISTAYTYYTDVFETDPATTAAWLPAAANAALLQTDRTA